MIYTKFNQTPFNRAMTFSITHDYELNRLLKKEYENNYEFNRLLKKDYTSDYELNRLLKKENINEYQLIRLVWKPLCATVAMYERLGLINTQTQDAILEYSIYQAIQEVIDKCQQ